MSATLTTVAGPEILDAGMKIAVYTVEFDDSYAATTGEAIDISGDFDYAYAVIPGGNDTLADNGVLLAAVLPGSTVAVTSSNVLISAHWSADGTDGEAFVEVGNEEDLSDIGAFAITVIGA